MSTFLYHKPRGIYTLLHSLLLALIINLAICPQTSDLSEPALHQHLKRALPNSPAAFEAPLGAAPPDSSGNRRGSDPSKPPGLNPTGTTDAPLSPASTPSPSPSPTRDSPIPSDALLPIIGNNPNPIQSTPTLSPTPTPTPSPFPLTGGLTPQSPLPNQPGNLSPTPTSPTPTPSPQAIPPNRAGIISSVNSTTSSLSPTPSPDASSTTRPARPASKSTENESSTLGSTTFKLFAIITGCIIGLFLLWTIIRKWKFRPSKRFAQKLEDDYGEDVFAPRPPSFGEKRPLDYQPYSTPPLSTMSPVYSGQYPAYPPAIRQASYHSNRPDLSPAPDPGPPQSYALHRTSNASITKPHAMFEPNPYRLTLGFGNPHPAYPPSDDPQSPKVL